MARNGLMNSSGIYMITNPDGFNYIGQAKSLRKRMNRYKVNDCKDIPLIYNSILCYGFDNHKIEILEYIDYDVDLLNEREKHWIELKQSNVNKFPNSKGLNLTDGGKGCCGRLMSIETRNKIKLANTGRIPSDESRAKMRGKRDGFLPAQSRLILNTATGIFYETIKNASLSTNIKRSTLNARLTGQNKNNTDFIYC